LVHWTNSRTPHTPPRRPVDGDEEAAALVSHLGQVFHVDVDVSGLIGFEGAVFGLGFFGLEIALISHTMPSQAAIQTRA